MPAPSVHTMFTLTVEAAVKSTFKISVAAKSKVSRFNDALAARGIVWLTPSKLTLIVVPDRL